MAETEEQVSIADRPPYDVDIVGLIYKFDHSRLLTGF
jgi:hypothetical protein